MNTKNNQRKMTAEFKKIYMKIPIWVAKIKANTRKKTFTEKEFDQTEREYGSFRKWVSWHRGNLRTLILTREPRRQLCRQNVVVQTKIWIWAFHMYSFLCAKMASQIFCQICELIFFFCVGSENPPVENQIKF